MQNAAIRRKLGSRGKSACTPAAVQQGGKRWNEYRQRSQQRAETRFHRPDNDQRRSG